MVIKTLTLMLGPYKKCLNLKKQYHFQERFTITEFHDYYFGKIYTNLILNSVNSVLGLMVVVVTIILLYQYFHIIFNQTVI